MGGYILGVDGGGTKTHCALFDMDGNKIDVITWGPTNHEGMREGFKELKEELGKLINAALGKHSINLNELGKCVFGLAGVDTKAQHSIISGILRDIGVKDFILCNDAFLGVKAGSPKGVGICVINGTGFTAAGIDSSGRMLQVGGQGSFTGDKGGGGYLGITAVSCVYDFLFKCGEYTVMADMMFERLNILSKYDFMDAITEGLNSGKTSTGELCRLLFSASNMNDTVALRILDDMGIEMAGRVNGIIEDLGFDGLEELDIVLAGSVNVKGENPAAIDRLKRDVSSKNPGRKINFKILQKPPVLGAVAWALDKDGYSASLYEKIAEQL